MEKSPEAFRTIREVADALDLPQHVLRFWETRFPQVRPLKRAGGRRYYRPDDVERLRLIRRLLYDEGYTIRGVQKLFKDPGVQALTGATPIDGGPSSRPAESSISGPEDMDAKALEPRLAGDEVDALLDALAKIRDAERILAQARSQAA